MKITADLSLLLVIAAAGLLILFNQRRPNAIAGAILTDMPANAPDKAKCEGFLKAKSPTTKFPTSRPCSEVCTQKVGNQADCAACEQACGMPNCGCYGTAPEDECAADTSIPGTRTMVEGCPHSISQA